MRYIYDIYATLIEQSWMCSLLVEIENRPSIASLIPHRDHDETLILRHCIC